MSSDSGSAAGLVRSLDSLHALTYFVPESGEELTAAGLDRARYHYFAARAAPMGPVPADVVAATFYNFNPAMIARAIPHAWELVSCQQIVAARLRIVDRAWRRLLGDDVVEGEQVAQAAELARAATVDLQPDGRALFAGHASLPWPDEPHLVLWHAITLLREHRGDAHVAALLVHGLDGLEALVTHTLGGRGFTVGAAKATRGWSDTEWDDATNRLRDRGLVDDAGLTADGVHLRDDIEAATDRVSLTPWTTLGAERGEQLRAIGKDLTRRAVAGGAFPPGVFASPKS